MPSLNPCPKCERDEFVRFERVITGVTSTRLYYCGSCDYEWRGNDAAPPEVKPPVPPMPKARSRTFRAKRRKDS